MALLTVSERMHFAFVFLAGKDSAVISLTALAVMSTIKNAMAMVYVTQLLETATHLVLAAKAGEGNAVTEEYQ